MSARLLATALLMALPVLPAWSADAPIIRAPLQSIEAPEAAHSVQSYLVAVAPNAVVPSHTHPGVEIGYCVSGALTVSVTGQPDRSVMSGDSWAFPAGVAHRLVNAGSAPAVLVVTYVVEKGKPLSSPAS